MKKIVFLSLLLGALILPQRIWAIQGDVSLHIPYYIGIQTDDEDAGQALDYAFLVPELRLTHYFGSEPIRVGVGIRTFTIILETLVFPVISLEAEYGNLLFNANVGGGAFLFFGLFNTFETAGIFIPEISTAYRFNEWFQLGTGVTLLMNPGATGDINSFGYVPTVFCRFTFGE